MGTGQSLPCPEPLPVVNVVTCVVYYSSPDPETPDARIPVEQLPRSVMAVVQHYNGRQHCSTETVLLIFPFLRTNITSQMWPGGGKEQLKVMQRNVFLHVESLSRLFASN